jgi:hypothetical protein
LFRSAARRLRYYARRALDRAGFAVFDKRGNDRYARDGLYTLHHPHFLQDTGFQAAYARGVQASWGVDPRMEWRVHTALWAASVAARLPGDFVECGVNAGFVSSAILQSLDWPALGKTFHLIDTFAGPVLTQFSKQEQDRRRLAEEAIAREAYVTDWARIQANYAEWPRVRLLPGAVPEVLDGSRIDRVAFLHLDMNCAYPERAALEFFWDRMTPGGMILFDDYAFTGNDALAAEIGEAAARLGTAVLALPTGQGLIVR